MKNLKKMIVSAMAAVMAAAALATTAGAQDLYNNFYRCTDSGTSYASSNSNTYYTTESYIGNDVFYGSIYYRSDKGYYADNGNGKTYLGQNFTFTEYIGTDRYGRKIYYRSEHGYIYYSGRGTVWYTLGYNYNNIAW